MFTQKEKDIISNTKRKYRSKVILSFYLDTIKDAGLQNYIRGLVFGDIEVSEDSIKRFLPETNKYFPA